MKQQDAIDKWRQIINPDSKGLDDETEYYVGFLNGIADYNTVGDNYEKVLHRTRLDSDYFTDFNNVISVRKFTQKEFYDRYKVDIKKYF